MYQSKVVDVSGKNEHLCREVTASKITNIRNIY